MHEAHGTYPEQVNNSIMYDSRTREFKAERIPFFCGNGNSLLCLCANTKKGIWNGIEMFASKNNNLVYILLMQIREIFRTAESVYHKVL